MYGPIESWHSALRDLRIMALWPSWWIQLEPKEIACFDGLCGFKQKSSKPHSPKHQG